MAKNKAFVRYANNKAVPGSLIVREKAPKVGVWKEVPADLCCNGGECSEISILTEFKWSTEPCVLGENIEVAIYSCNGKFVLKTYPDLLPVPDGYYSEPYAPSGVSINYHVENSIVIEIIPCL